MTTPDHRARPAGHLHPMTLLVQDALRVMTDLGFDVADGPELETEYYNFDALNVPRDHPSRDMQDTFFVKGGEGKTEYLGLAKRPQDRVLLRTQTSSVQIRYMKENMAEGVLPPYAVIVPGRVFRNEATDATHECQFTQLEGLMVGKDISLATLKGTLERFFSVLFGTETTIRMRSSFFPFVEPGVEVDVQCFKCKGSGAACNVCKATGWIEVMGAGMVHPKVLLECGIDPRSWRGFAFGMGLDRIAMLKWGIDDVRLFYHGDVRLSAQF